MIPLQNAQLCEFIGDHGKDRTCDLQFRKLLDVSSGEFFHTSDSGHLLKSISSNNHHSSLCSISISHHASSWIIPVCLGEVWERPITHFEFTTGPQQRTGGFMARHTNGWIKIYRAAILGDIGANYNRAGLFSALVAFANIQPSTVVWRGKPRKIARGELVTSLQELADLGEIDSRTVSRHLKYLEVRGTISVEKSSTGTFIKINNYEQYQGQDAEGSGPAPDDMHNDRHDDLRAIGIHNKELKNKRIKELKNSLEFDLNFEFKRLAKKYRDLFPGTTTGPKALDQFKVQFKTPADIQDLETSFAHYRELLNESDWRKPKGTFAAYMGTKSSGHFWKDFIEKPNLVTSNGKDPFAFLFEGKDEPA